MSSAEKSRRSRKQNPLMTAWHAYRNEARKRGREFRLERGVFYFLLKRPCYYCGAAADPVNGIDRVDSSQGYILGNVVTACRRCNVAKHTLSQADFIALAKLIAARFPGYPALGPHASSLASEAGKSLL